MRAVTKNGLPVGQVRLHFGVDSNDPSVAEISYWVGRAYWGRGIAGAAVAAFLTQIRDEHPAVTALVAKVKTGNRASERVLLRAGFLAEGRDPDDPHWMVYRLPRA